MFNTSINQMGWDGLLQTLELLAHIFLARVGISPSGLSQESLPLRFPKPSSQWLKRIVDIVRHTLDILAAIIGIEVPMDVKY